MIWFSTIVTGFPCTGHLFLSDTCLPRQYLQSANSELFLVPVCVFVSFPLHTFCTFYLSIVHSPHSLVPQLQFASESATHQSIHLFEVLPMLSLIFSKHSGSCGLVMKSEHEPVPKHLVVQTFETTCFH